MKKLLILCFLLFLSSCSSSDVEMTNVYFTEGDGISSLTYTNKFENFDDFSNALEDGLRFYNFTELFDSEFYIRHDLIVVYFTSLPYKTCDDFRLNGVRIQNKKLTVSVSSFVELNSGEPYITISGRYFYLIAIDKTEITDVELIFD